MPPRRPSVLSRGTAERFERMALSFLGRQDRTQAQLRLFLRRKGAPAATIESIIKRLVQQGYVNDAEYALRWARGRLSARPMGRPRLEAELLARGVDRALAEQTLALIFRDYTEEGLARQRLAMRSRGRTSRTATQTAGLLRRYGFSEDIIEKLLNESQRG